MEWMLIFNLLLLFPNGSCEKVFRRWMSDILLPSFLFWGNFRRNSLLKNVSFSESPGVWLPALMPTKSQKELRFIWYLAKSIAPRSLPFLQGFSWPGVTQWIVKGISTYWAFLHCLHPFHLARPSRSVLGSDNNKAQMIQRSPILPA